MGDNIIARHIINFIRDSVKFLWYTFILEKVCMYHPCYYLALDYEKAMYHHVIV